METISETTTADVAVASEDKATSTDCLIHLRFNPNGTVFEIGERPAGIEAQEWFNYLSRHTLNCYQALSGGRGLFRLPRTEVEALKSACATSGSAT